jgi:hypothetical protein
MSSSINSVPQTSQSPLLRISNEVRNQIFNYVLTTDDPNGLFYYLEDVEPNTTNIPFSKRAVLTDDEYGDRFNQLQFVNKQTRKETVGRDLELNSLNFVNYDEAPGISSVSRLFEFVAILKPSLHSYLNSVTVISSADWRERTPDLLPEVSMLSHFCKQHPTVTVRYIIRGFEYVVYAGNNDRENLYAFVIKAAFFSQMFAGAGGLFPCFVQVSEVLSDAKADIGAWGILLSDEKYNHMRVVLDGLDNLVVLPETRDIKDIHFYNDDSTCSRDCLVQYDDVKSWIEDGFQVRVQHDRFTEDVVMEED